MSEHLGVCHLGYAKTVFLHRPRFMDLGSADGLLFFVAFGLHSATKDQVHVCANDCIFQCYEQSNYPVQIRNLGSQMAKKKAIW